MSADETGKHDLTETANYLRLISHPSRLAIVFRLLSGPCLVSEMETKLGLHQPNLSQHLSILRDANILASRRQAKTVLYDLKEGIARNMIHAIAASLAPSRDDPPAHPPRPQARVRPRESDDASVFAHVLPFPSA